LYFPCHSHVSWFCFSNQMKEKLLEKEKKEIEKLWIKCLGIDYFNKFVQLLPSSLWGICVFFSIVVSVVVLALVVEVFVLLGLLPHGSTSSKLFHFLHLALVTLHPLSKSSWLTLCILHEMVENLEPYLAYGSLLDWMEYQEQPFYTSQITLGGVSYFILKWGPTGHAYSLLIEEGLVLRCVSILGCFMCCI